MRVLPRPYCHAHERSTFGTLCAAAMSNRKSNIATTFLCKLRSVSHADNATIEAATREYGVDAERIRACVS